MEGDLNISKFALISFVLIVLISGCTGGSTPSTTTHSPPPITTPTLKPASFSVSGLNPPKEPVTAGQVAQVSATISNSGELNGNYTASLKINSIEYKTQELSLAPNENKIVTFEVIEQKAGTYTLQIGEATGTLTVQSIPMSTSVIDLKDMPVGYKAIPVTDSGFDMTQTYYGAPCSDYFGYSCNNSSCYGIFYGIKNYPVSTTNQSLFDNNIIASMIKPSSYAASFNLGSLTVKSWELIPEFSQLGDGSIGIRFHVDNNRNADDVRGCDGAIWRHDITFLWLD